MRVPQASASIDVLLAARISYRTAFAFDKDGDSSFHAVQRKVWVPQRISHICPPLAQKQMLFWIALNRSPALHNYESNVCQHVLHFLVIDEHDWNGFQIVAS